MTSEIVYAPMNEAEARRLTAQIASSVENTYDLLDEAMRREAWKALGYKTPAAYLRAEFPVSKSRAYQLIDQATVRRELTAIGVHNVDDLPEAHARVLAPIVRKGGPAAAAAVVDAARAKHGDSVTADDRRAASQPEPHPPTDGDRSTHPAPEVPPAPSSPEPSPAEQRAYEEAWGHPEPDWPALPQPESPDEEVMPSTPILQPLCDTPPAAEPSEPGVAGAVVQEFTQADLAEIVWPGAPDPVVESLSAELHAIYQKEARRQKGIGEDEVRHPDEYDALPEHTKEYDRVLARFILARPCTDPAHADLLGLLGDLDRLLLPRDEEDWRAWDLGDQEAEGRALMERVRSLLGDAQTAQDAPEEAPSPDPRIPAIRARLRALGPKQRAAFCRMHNVRAEALDGWVAGLNDGELDTAARELGLVGAETA